MAELNRLEREILCQVQYELHVMPETYFQYARQIAEHYVKSVSESTGSDRLIVPDEACPQKIVKKQLSIDSMDTAPFNNE